MAGQDSTSTINDQQLSEYMLHLRSTAQKFTAKKCDDKRKLIEYFALGVEVGGRDAMRRD